MKKLIMLVIVLAIWYGVFAFLTTKFNPMEWDIWIKLLAVFIAINSLSSAAEIED